MAAAISMAGGFPHSAPGNGSLLAGGFPHSVTGNGSLLAGGFPHNVTEGGPLVAENATKIEAMLTWSIEEDFKELYEASRITSKNLPDFAKDISEVEKAINLRTVRPKRLRDIFHGKGYDKSESFGVTRRLKRRDKAGTLPSLPLVASGPGRENKGNGHTASPRPQRRFLPESYTGAAYGDASGENEEERLTLARLLDGKRSADTLPDTPVERERRDAPPTQSSQMRNCARQVYESLQLIKQLIRLKHDANWRDPPKDPEEHDQVYKDCFDPCLARARASLDAKNQTSPELHQCPISLKEAETDARLRVPPRTIPDSTDSHYEPFMAALNTAIYKVCSLRRIQKETKQTEELLEKTLNETDGCNLGGQQRQESSNTSSFSANITTILSAFGGACLGMLCMFSYMRCFGSRRERLRVASPPETDVIEMQQFMHDRAFDRDPPPTYQAALDQGGVDDEAEGPLPAGSVYDDTAASPDQERVDDEAEGPSPANSNSFFLTQGGLWAWSVGLLSWKRERRLPTAHPHGGEATTGGATSYS